MTDPFFRFPHTAHVAWLGTGEPRDDKVLLPAERDALFQGDVFIEEKVDGANLGLSVDEDCNVRAQNRGTWLDPKTAHPQFKPLWPWLRQRQDALVERLWPDRILFGEWCFATHSIRYSRLPDWFLAFDVYDRTEQRFWSVTRRDRFIDEGGLARVPSVGSGRHTVESAVALLAASALTDGPAEGLIVRRDEGDWSLVRGKLVRAEFVQQIGSHWSHAPLRQNTLAGDAPSPAPSGSATQAT